MILSDLLRNKPAKVINARRYSNFVLTTVLLVQFILLGIKLQETSRQRKEFDITLARLALLKAEEQKFQTNTDLQQLAGKVAARNNWFIDRRNNPLNLLTKLQKDCPNNVQFSAYNADLSGGRIVLTAPDLSSVSSWLNSHFGQRGNLSVTRREGDLLQIQFLWSG